ncbi:MAG: hypothetical protein H7Y06_08950 [Opitutaceae bacterium]|nr:hypothetical protein [Opitutaceae bacterium]
MNTTDITRIALRFTQPLNLHFNRETTRPDITRPFFETHRRPAQHDMLLLNTHPELLPTPELAPPRDLNFFNFDRP